MTKQFTVMINGILHSTHDSFRDAVDQADMIRGSVDGEKSAYEYARREQGFAGTFDEWLSQDNDERGEYETGAQGIGTVR